MSQEDLDRLVAEIRGQRCRARVSPLPAAAPGSSTSQVAEAAGDQRAKDRARGDVFAVYVFRKVLATLDASGEHAPERVLGATTGQARQLLDAGAEWDGPEHAKP